MFDRTQTHLLFRRYAAPRFSYAEFCKMVVPNDSHHSGKVLSRVPRSSPLLFETNEILRRVLRALLSLEQAQEYIRLRFNKVVLQESWCVKNLFRAVDREDKGAISVFDLEKLIINHKRSGSRSLVSDIDLLIALYDKTGTKRVGLWDFQDFFI